MKNKKLKKKLVSFSRRKIYGKETEKYCEKINCSTRLQIICCKLFQFVRFAQSLSVANWDYVLSIHINKYCGCVRN